MLEQQQARVTRFLGKRGLNLVYAGRLARIKGVLDLPVVVRALHDQSVPATLDVCGDGPDMHAMRADTERLGLSDFVTFHGSLQRKPELNPLLRGTSDVFVCPHHQGDPSHVYLEMMGCGVVPVGYANDSLRAFETLHGIGTTVPMKDTQALARRIAELTERPRILIRMSENPRSFAREHLFKKTWRRRIDHLAPAYLPEGSSGHDTRPRTRLVTYPHC